MLVPAAFLGVVLIWATTPFAIKYISEPVFGELIVIVFFDFPKPQGSLLRGQRFRSAHRLLGRKISMHQFARLTLETFMCGRFVQYSDPEVYASHFDLDSICDTTPRYNVAPSQPVLAIRRAEGGQRELITLRWGLIPSWSNGPDSRYSMINARAETVDSKPAYRNAFKNRRCLIPAEGFYEWKAEQRGKTPFLIRRTDSEPFAMAGLWERWRGKDGEALESCTIIVTDANELVENIHDRMPVILRPEDYGAWLDPETKNTDRLLELLRPISPDLLAMHAVSRQVNSPRNDSQELLAAAAISQE